jgi:hypothetical protein
MITIFYAFSTTPSSLLESSLSAHLFAYIPNKLDYHGTVQHCTNHGFFFLMARDVEGIEISPNSTCRSLSPGTTSLMVNDKPPQSLPIYRRSYGELQTLLYQSPRSAEYFNPADGQ